jgi:NAD(P)H-hydrate epimerase
MIVTAQQMKAAEEAAFLEGATPAGLMEIAGEGIANCISQFYPDPCTAVVYCGKGHNGGDALVVGRHLQNRGWRVLVRLAAAESDLAELTRRQLHALQKAEVIESLPTIFGQQFLLLDGLLGIGSTGVPRGTVADLIEEMNTLRRKQGGYTVAIDLPSGLDATDGVAKGVAVDTCVQANLTVTIGAVKSGLVADNATAEVGRLALVPLPGVSFPQGDPFSVSNAQSLRAMLPTRNFDSFKGSYGRIGILAGSRGFLGAARLSSAAAVHAGGGLVTLYATPDSYELLAETCVPEVMVQRVDSYLEVMTERNDVLALGPGLGREHDHDLRRIIAESPLPCVVDADALNAISIDVSILSRCAGPRLLTPHPGEMERLVGQGGRSRREWASAFVELYPVTLLLKGARTIIAQHDAPLAFNSTGNPGMGSGGMGDVLTGVCAALIGSNQSPRDAAMLGAWLCGRAAESAIFNGSDSQESLSATSVIDHLGAAFKSLRMGEY